MSQRLEVALPQPEEGGAVKFGVAADVVVRMRMERLAGAIAPRFRGVVAALDVDRARVPIGLLASHVIAALEDQNALSRCRQPVAKRSAAGAAADDDHVVPLAHLRAP